MREEGLTEPDVDDDAGGEPVGEEAERGRVDDGEPAEGPSLSEGPSLGPRKKGRRGSVREPAHAKAVQQLLLGVCPPSLAPSAAGGAEAAVPVARVLERLRDDGGVCGERGAPEAEPPQRRAKQRRRRAVLSWRGRGEAAVRRGGSEEGGRRGERGGGEEGGRRGERRQ